MPLAVRARMGIRRRLLGVTQCKPARRRKSIKREGRRKSIKREGRRKSIKREGRRKSIKREGMGMVRKHVLSLSWIQAISLRRLFHALVRHPLCIARRQPLYRRLH